MMTVGAIVIAAILLLALCAFLDELPAVLVWALAVWWLFFSDDEESPISLPAPQEQTQQVEVKETPESCKDDGGVWLYDECIK